LAELGQTVRRLGRGQAGGRGLQVGEGLLGAEAMDPHGTELGAELDLPA